MVSHKYKFIFIHAPKTAGNSIQNILMNYSEDKILGRSKKGKPLEAFEVRSGDPRFKGCKHTTLRQYYAWWRKKYGNIEDFYKFGVCRNPWERVISWYFHGDLDYKKCGIFKKEGFMKRAGSCPTCYQSFSVPPCETIQLDYVMRFETLQQDFDTVCHTLGIPVSPLPHVNKTNHEHYTEYYDDEMRDLVARVHSKDIEHFGYKFGD